MYTIIHTTIFIIICRTRMKDVEEQQESSLQWSIKQIEEYYKQKLNTRKRVRSSEDNVEKTKDIKELEYENSHLTSKLVSMKDTIYELKQKNQVLSIEKNKIEYELSLIKEELKYTKCLVDAAEKDLFHDEERKHYVEEIKSQLSLKESHVKKLKEFLNEAKEEYIAITSDGRKKEHQIKEQEELIIEYEDKMEDMQEQIERINYLLADRNAMIEKLDENKQTMADKIIELENKLKLVNEDYEVDISYKQEVLNKSEHNETDNFCVNVIIKEDLSEKDETQSEETVNTSDTNKNISTEKIIIESEEKSISTKCKESLTLKEDKSCQTVELVTQEVILQTSFLENDKEEDNLKIVKELQKNITKMEIDLNAKQIEKTNLENLIEENMKQQQVLVEKLQESNKKEKDKDDEITAIQKELKQMILAKDIEERSVTFMEKELKETLRVLDDREKELSFYKQKVSSLELRTFELNQELKPAQITSDQQIELVHDNRKLTEINELLNRSMKRKTTEFEELEMRYLRGIDSYNWTYKILQEEITELKDQNQKLSFCSAPPPNGDAIKQLQTCADYTMVKGYESQSDKGDESNTESKTLSVERSLRSRRKHKKIYSSMKCKNMNYACTENFKRGIIRTSVREGMEDELSEEDFYEQTREEVMHYVPCPSPAHRGRKICIWDGKAPGKNIY
ncbi:hypothetical protein M0802_015767 [Mischocyttarus mexicanus]|nr:hypothetical protein M0802_015767 [Mischocyttarus mexicanus]